MDTDDKMVRLLSERLDKIQRIRSYFDLLPKLSELVFNELVKLKQRCLDSIDTVAQGESIMKLLKDNAARIHQTQENADSMNHRVKDAQEIFERITNTEQIGEAEDTSVDEMLDRSLTLLEESQAQLEQQLFDLHAVGVELDKKLNKPRPLS